KDPQGVGCVRSEGHVRRDVPEYPGDPLARSAGRDRTPAPGAARPRLGGGRARPVAGLLRLPDEPYQDRRGHSSPGTAGAGYVLREAMVAFVLTGGVAAALQLHPSLLGGP